MVPQKFGGQPRPDLIEQTDAAMTMTDFALDFYSSEPVTISSSDEEPTEEEVQHWQFVYDEARDIGWKTC